MKTYTITVNGNVYDVTVEEGTSAAASVAAPKVAPRPVAPAPAAATPVPAPAPAPAAPAKPAASGTAGSIRVEAGAAGKVFGNDAAVGQAVKAGDPVVTIEAMKMENDIVATADGVITYAVEIGANVETDAVLAYIK